MEQLQLRTFDEFVAAAVGDVFEDADEDSALGYLNRYTAY